MASWQEFTAAAPELAKLARELFEAHRHLTLATLRKDGSPRISGIECRFIDDDLWFGSMPDAVKAYDLQRDPRFALHSGTGDADQWKGDAKVAGRAEEITDEAERHRILHEMTGGQDPPGGKAHLFRLDLDEVSVVRLNDARNGIVIDVWTPERGVRRIERA